MILQRYVLKREAEQAERMSVHSAMLGGANSTFGRNSTLPPRNGSVMSGSMRGSNFQRGGSLRGSDRSVKSHRRDIDDMALSMHHMGGSQHHLATGNGSSMAGYGRKDLDDMVLSQHIAQNRAGAVPLQGQYPSHYSSRETGYNSGNEGSARVNRAMHANFPESTFLQREEVETEIF